MSCCCPQCKKKRCWGYAWLYKLYHLLLLSITHLSSCILKIRWQPRNLQVSPKGERAEKKKNKSPHLFPYRAAPNLPRSHWGRAVRTLPSCQIRCQFQFAFSTTHICSKPFWIQLISAKSLRRLMFTCVRQHPLFDPILFSKKYTNTQHFVHIQGLFLVWISVHVPKTEYFIPLVYLIRKTECFFSLYPLSF